jgi:hypothetical protein
MINLVAAAANFAALPIASPRTCPQHATAQRETGAPPWDSLADGRQDRLRPRRRHDFSPLEHAAITAPIPLEPQPPL